MIEVGKICISTTPFFNSRTGKNEFKKRPVLIIGQADSADYNVLPISRVTNSRHLDPVYDIKVDPIAYPRLSLTAVSYVRTHKQTVVHQASLNEISSMKDEYPNLYSEVITKLEEYTSMMIGNAKI